MVVELSGCTDKTLKPEYSLLSENSEDLSHRTLDLFWQKCPELRQNLTRIPCDREGIVSALIGIFGFIDSSGNTPCSRNTMLLAQPFLSLKFSPTYFLLLGECIEQALTDVLFEEATKELIDTCLEIHNQVYTLLLENGS